MIDQAEQIDSGKEFLKIDPATEEARDRNHKLEIYTAVIKRERAGTSLFTGT